MLGSHDLTSDLLARENIGSTQQVYSYLCEIFEYNNVIQYSKAIGNVSIGACIYIRTYNCIPKRVKSPYQPSVIPNVQAGQNTKKTLEK